MGKLNTKDARRRRHLRARAKLHGTAVVPRMCVCCTGKHMYVQLTDDDTQRTILSASTREAEFRKTDKKADMEGAVVLGKLAADKARGANIDQVIFDRGGFRFHGRIKALADAAREAGLKF